MHPNRETSRHNTTTTAWMVSPYIQHNIWYVGMYPNRETSRHNTITTTAWMVSPYIQHKNTIQNTIQNK